MSRPYKRKNPSDQGIPPEWFGAIEEGELGPWKSSDKAEFYHAGVEAQQWFLRLDADDIAAVLYAVKVGSWVRSAIKWGRRAFWAFTVGLGAAVTAGENLQKLPGMISATLSALRGLFGS